VVWLEGPSGRYCGCGLDVAGRWDDRYPTNPYHDGHEAVEGRNVFHKPRTQALDPFNGSDRNVFASRTNAPVNGLQWSQLLALAAVVVYRSVLLSHHG
jgi:hypothetical protein